MTDPFDQRFLALSLFNEKFGEFGERQIRDANKKAQAALEFKGRKSGLVDGEDYGVENAAQMSENDAAAFEAAKEDALRPGNNGPPPRSTSSEPPGEPPRSSKAWVLIMGDWKDITEQLEIKKFS